MLDLKGHFVAHVFPLPPAVQMDFATDPTLSGRLCEAPDLDPAVWEKLRSTARSAAHVTCLVTRLLTVEQRCVILNTEKRISVIGAMYSRNPVTLPELDLLDLSQLNSGLGWALFTAFSDNPKVLARIGPHLPTSWRIRYLATAGDTVSDDEVIATLLDIETWWGKARGYGDRNDALRELFILRPALIGCLARANPTDALQTVIAGSKDLRDPEDQRAFLASTAALSEYALLAFIANPRVSPDIVRSVKEHLHSGLDIYKLTKGIAGRLARHDVTITGDYDKLDDLAELAWVTYRALPRGGEYPQDGRLPDLLDLARNSALSPEDATRVADGILSLCPPGPLVPLASIAARVLSTNFPALTEKLSALVDGTYGSEEYRTPVEDRYDADRPINQPETILARRLGDVIQYSCKYLAGPLTEILGDDPTVWRMFLQLADTHQDDRFSIAELAETVQAICA